MKNETSILLHISNQNFGSKVKIRYRQPQKDSPYHLYLDYYTNGVRRTKSLNLSVIGTKETLQKDMEMFKVALAVREEIEKKIVEGETGVSLAKPKQTDFIVFFKKFCEKKPDRSYKTAFDHLMRFLDKESLNIKQIDIPFCEDLKQYLLSLDIKAYTALHYFVAFKAALNYAVSLNYINSNPAKNISIKYEKKSIERLYEDEISKLMDTFCTHSDIKNGFLFACFTGLRFSDLNSLKYSDIINNHVKIIQKKTKNEVVIKINPTVRKIIEEQEKKKKDDRIFHLPTGGKRSKILKKWFEDAGIRKELTFHCSRHTFGCLLVENNVEVFTVKKLMGHSDVKTTLQYVEKVDETKDRAIDKLPVF